MAEPDLLKAVCGPALDAVRGAIANAPLPAPIQSALHTLLSTSGLIAVALACGALGTVEQRLRGERAVRMIAAGCGTVAVVLGAWIVGHPSDRFDGLFARWDHLAFAGSAGFAITVLAGARRQWVLAALSAGVLLQYAGALALGVSGGLSAAGIGLLQTRLRVHRAALAGAQALLIVVAYGCTFWLRSRNFEQAGRVQALLTFWMLRHISLIAVAARTGPPSAADCTAFLGFYPGVMGLFGAPEIYSEFARRNLARPPVVQHRRAARRIVGGVAQITLAMLVPVSVADIEASASLLQAWATSIAFFVRTALAVMGAWKTVDGVALLYGVQLRANFAGLLTCRNPSELWWSWRGTLTNWLVQFVYAPLGGSRRHQTVNIAAAFAVSLAWHALGAPFITPEFRWVYVTPIALWAVINGTAVIGHVWFVRRAGRAHPAGRVGRLRTAVAIVLTWALGSLTPILLQYHGRSVERLWDLLGALTGIR